MKQIDALMIQTKIKDICIKNKLYFDETKTNKPDLTMIELKILIKVDKE